MSINSKPSSSSGVHTPSHLSEKLIIEGSIYSKGKVFINGYVAGTVVGEGEIQIGVSGSIHGTIESQKVVVSGKIDGTLVAKNEAKILKEAKIQGDLLVSRGGLIIHQGAIIEGECHSSDEFSSTSLSKPEKRK